MRGNEKNCNNFEDPNCMKMNFSDLLRCLTCTFTCSESLAFFLTLLPFHPMFKKKVKNLRKAEHIELFFLFAQTHSWYLRIIVSLAALLSSYLLVVCGFHYTDT